MELGVRLVAVLLCAGAAAAQPAPQLATLTASADATLIEDPTGALANGAGINTFTGRIAPSGGSTLRRTLIRFDLGSIPRGAVIRTASLRLSLTRSRFAGDLPVSVHRVTAAWTEGPSSSAQGIGEASQPGDATWIHRSKPTLLWAAPGGDFIAAASATRIVGATGGAYDWSSNAGLVADVQAWLDTPAVNHGWIVLGFEGGGTSAKGFAARETASPGDRPTLTIAYDPPVEEIPVPPWAVALLAVALGSAVMRRRRKHPSQGHP